MVCSVCLTPESMAMWYLHTLWRYMYQHVCCFIGKVLMNILFNTFSKFIILLDWLIWFLYQFIVRERMLISSAILVQRRQKNIRSTFHLGKDDVDRWHPQGRNRNIQVIVKYDILGISMISVYPSKLLNVLKYNQDLFPYMIMLTSHTQSWLTPI